MVISSKLPDLIDKLRITQARGPVLPWRPRPRRAADNQVLNLNPLYACQAMGQFIGQHRPQAVPKNIHALTLANQLQNFVEYARDRLAYVPVRFFKKTLFPAGQLGSNNIERTRQGNPVLEKRRPRCRKGQADQRKP